MLKKTPCKDVCNDEAKIYFLDVGLAARLQGWTERQPLLMSPQAGHCIQSERIPKSFRQLFPGTAELILVSLGGKKLYLEKNCLQLPISELKEYLLAH